MAYKTIVRAYGVGSIFIGGGNLEQQIVDKLFDKMNAMAILINTLITESRAKDSVCIEHKKTTNDHEARIRTLELASVSVTLVTQINQSQENRIQSLENIAATNLGSSQTNRNWKDTLINIVTMAATVGATVAVVVTMLRM